MTGQKIAFYAPLKSPDHPVPSGDRQMARMLIYGLRQAGYQVELASQCRAFLNDSLDSNALSELERRANLEIKRLTENWKAQGPPSLWFCYHPYYKSPDLIGPALCEKFDMPVITAEASYSVRRNHGIWIATQEKVLATINRAVVNICFTQRDEAGLRAVSKQANLISLKPFIDTSEYIKYHKKTRTVRFVTVAMMRAGDKMLSYKHLARSLKKLLHLQWTLSIVGDGELRSEVHRLFDGELKDRVKWHGKMPREAIAELFSHSTLYLWPGCGEAYGLAYLEAQSAGLPVVAFRTAGVADVVYDKTTGLLTPAGDENAYASAIADLLSDSEEIARLSANARSQAQSEHSLESASNCLDGLLKPYVEGG
ncbi:MAG: glycosyltransferase family 4 protein [Granulosicoccus sp.]|nr:glycosyltransferase family 4 protein [Granulosicoccus sp.]